MSFKEKAKELIQWVLTVDDSNMEILPVWVLDSARLNTKRPAKITIAVPDDYVKNLNGLDLQDVYLMVKVPHATHEEFVNWSGQPDAIKKATGIWIEKSWNKSAEQVVMDVNADG